MNKIRLVSWVLAVSTLLWQVSSASAASIHLYTPNGGEVWNVNTIHPIMWSNQGFDTIRLDYRTSDTSAWRLIADGISGRISRYAWKVPNTPTTTAKVRVKGYFADGSSYQYDYSDNYFTIYRPIALETLNLITPNGGEIWEAGDTQTIKWTSTGYTDVRLDYRISDSSQWQLIADRLDAYSSAYNWTIPKISTTNTAKIRIKGYYSQGGLYQYDYSDRYFTVHKPVEIITLRTPIGGEWWRIGYYEAIKWDTYNITNNMEFIVIEIKRDENSEWETIGYRPYSQNNPSTFMWKAQGPETNTALVRVSLWSKRYVNDVSSGYFNIMTSI